MWKVYVSSVDGVHIIGTSDSKNEAVVKAKKWLGSYYTEISFNCWVSKYGDKVYIEQEGRDTND